jgi:hypothetical protein
MRLQAELEGAIDEPAIEPIGMALEGGAEIVGETGGRPGHSSP